jgi:hypothetical protein
MANPGTEIIKRYFSDNIFKQIEADFLFLIEKIKDSGFEYDLQIRDNYFNLYYKGNSIGKVSYKVDLYSVSINRKFISEEIERRFKPVEKSTYLVFNLAIEQLHSLFSTENLLSMGRKVKEVHYQEEIAFEQMLVTDNVNREDFIIIDRQVSDNTSRRRMDLLALAKKEGNKYQFCVIEVKLGNNKELQGAVVGQLTHYVERITENFDEYKKCYQKNLEQKQALKLINFNLKISIVPGVLGLIVIGGYSGKARKSIKSLKEDIKSQEVGEHIKLLHLENIIKIENAKSIAEL